MTTNISPAAPRSSVKFSPWSEMVVVPQGEDLEHRWLSHEDYARIKKTLCRDIRWASTLFASTPSNDITKDEWLKCIGIEHFLDLESTRQLEERKRRHVKAIVVAQRVLGDEELSKAAEKSSRWAGNGARRRARVRS